MATPLSISVPFPVFQDRDGQPLENGYIWLGVPNLNPQVNPVIAYFDEALTIVAPQPLRTLNGYISRAGTPAQVFIDGVNFSILVQDSKGSMVYNFPDGTGISPDACGVTYNPPFTGGVAIPVCEKLAQTVSVKDFGAVGDGVADDTAAFTAAVAAVSTAIYVPQGVYRVSAVTGTSAYFYGDGADSSVIELATTGTALIFEVDELRLQNLGFSDRGRSSMDHTANGNVYLFESTDLFRADNCVFLTDRSVLNQSPTANAKGTIVTQSKVSRVNAPVVSEEDSMDIFAILTGVPYIYFNGIECNELVARSVINATFLQTTVGQMKAVTAIVENCRFDYIHNSGTLNEVKCIFLQGYTSTVQNNSFTDCFGRHIDCLGNLDGTSVKGVFQPNTVQNNKIGYTTARQSATGFNNTEAGSIFCRYADVSIIGNIADYTNLLLSSAGYHAISVRHGYKTAFIQGNTIISAKAHGIEADISDTVDTDQCAVTIIGNNVNSIRAGRLPISISNNSAAKTFSNVVIRDNTINYTLDQNGIVLDSFPARASSFSMENVIIEGNYNPILNTLDQVDFQTFPENLYAPNVSLTITVNPAGTNLNGVITSLSNAIMRSNFYECRALTIQLDPAVTTTQTITGSVSINFLPQTTTINGNNGASGRIRFFTAGTEQNNVLVSGLDNNMVVFDGCIFESDSVSSTTALIAATGFGELISKSCTFNYGEYAVDTRGPNVSVTGGTIDNINLGSTVANGIFFVNSDRLVSLMIKDTTGASNNRLYNFVTPAVLMYENISVGTTAGLKNFTLVT